MHYTLCHLISQACATLNKWNKIPEVNLQHFQAEQSLTYLMELPFTWAEAQNLWLGFMKYKQSSENVFFSGFYVGIPH